MGSTNKTLLTALIVSLFSLSAIQGIKILRLENEPQVLGVTSPAAPGVPCNLINSWQQRFCSNVGSTIPTPMPTSTTPSKYPTPSQPIPTPSLCKTGFSNLTFGTVCKNDSTRNTYASFTCYDGFRGNVGDTTGINCYSQDDLRTKATSACLGHTSCTAAKPSPSYPPTPILATPTPKF